MYWMICGERVSWAFVLRHLLVERSIDRHRSAEVVAHTGIHVEISTEMFSNDFCGRNRLRMGNRMESVDESTCSPRGKASF